MRTPIRAYMAAINAIRLVKAFTAASESRDDDARLLLEKIGPNADHVYDVRLLRGFLYEKAGRFDESFREFTEAHRLISKSRRLSGPAKAYLETYAAKGALYSADRLPRDNLPPEIETSLPVSFDDIDLDKVPSSIKREFPLPDHPGWNQDAAWPQEARLRTWLKRLSLSTK